MLQSCFVVSSKDLVEFTDDERNEDECNNPGVVVDVISWSILVSSDARFTDFSSNKSWDVSGLTERLYFLPRSLLLCKQKKTILVFINFFFLKKKTTKTFTISLYWEMGFQRRLTNKVSNITALITQERFLFRVNIFFVSSLFPTTLMPITTTVTDTFRLDNDFHIINDWSKTKQELVSWSILHWYL
jgi:hypothetical protein